MKEYSLIVSNDMFKKSYNIRTTNIQQATKLAKIKFAKQFHTSGFGLKVGLDPNDLRNHIQEILQQLHK